MSQQINLYDPRFLKKRDLLTLANLLLAAALVYALLAAVGVMAWQQSAQRQAVAAAAEAQAKALRDQVEALTKAAATRAPSPQLTAEVTAAEAVARRREDIATLLESGAVGDTTGFAEHLRGFARQTPDGLWLTGFSIGAGGSEMEIRGRMLNPGALPDYIRRLGTEKAFHGRQFAALTVSRPPPPSASTATGAGGAATPPATVPYTEFVLRPSGEARP